MAFAFESPVVQTFTPGSNPQESPFRFSGKQSRRALTPVNYNKTRLRSRSNSCPDFSELQIKEIAQAVQYQLFQAQTPGRSLGRRNKDKENRRSLPVGVKIVWQTPQQLQSKRMPLQSATEDTEDTVRPFCSHPQIAGYATPQTTQNRDYVLNFIQGDTPELFTPGVDARTPQTHLSTPSDWSSSPDSAGEAVGEREFKDDAVASDVSESFELSQIIYKAIEFGDIQNKFEGLKDLKKAAKEIRPDLELIFYPGDLVFRKKWLDNNIFYLDEVFSLYHPDWGVSITESDYREVYTRLAAILTPIICTEHTGLKSVQFRGSNFLTPLVSIEPTIDMQSVSSEEDESGVQFSERETAIVKACLKHFTQFILEENDSGWELSLDFYLNDFLNDGVVCLDNICQLTPSSGGVIPEQDKHIKKYFLTRLCTHLTEKLKAEKLGVHLVTMTGIDKPIPEVPKTPENFYDLVRRHIASNSVYDSPFGVDNLDPSRAEARAILDADSDSASVCSQETKGTDSEVYELDIIEEPGFKPSRLDYLVARAERLRVPVDQSAPVTQKPFIYKHGSKNTEPESFSKKINKAIDFCKKPEVINATIGLGLMTSAGTTTLCMLGLVGVLGAIAFGASIAVGVGVVASAMVFCGLAGYKGFEMAQERGWVQNEVR